MRDLPHLAARLFDTPLLAHPAKARQVASVFASHIGKRVMWDDDDWTPPDQYQSGAQKVEGRGSAYPVIEGVAILPIAGSLAHKTGNLHPSSGMTGYDGIATKLRLARQDSRVRGILMDINSPGGEVAGAFDLADEIFAGSARKGGKPIWAIANETAASAAYLLASQADVLVAPRTARVGSVGVVVMHRDVSGALDDAGIKITLIHSGARKIDGNPYEALAEDVRASIQADLDNVREMFADAVARGRGMSKAAVLATEAADYFAIDAKAAGLVDAIASETQTLAAMISELRKAA